MPSDTLSDVLRSVRLRGAVFYYVSCGVQWAAEAPPSREIGAAVMPDVEHVMEFHLITKGSGWAAIVGETPVRLGAGDIVMFPRGDAHVMSSAPGLRPEKTDVAWIRETRADPKPIPVSYMGAEKGTSGAPTPEASTTVVCGFLGCDLRPFNPLIATLPRLLHVPAAGDSAWLAQVMQQAVTASQTKRPGSEALLERMSEMMFVDAVRRYVDALPDQSTGWLAGLRDRHVGRALALMHGDPARDWQVEALAETVALSRSALYDRFMRLVGQPPMQYLAQWRMQVASNLLLQGHASVAAIALKVGYDSEAAFARAFKRLMGMPPAAWRRARAGAPQNPV
jgi:AraC-like DNA-binding protein